MFPPPLVPAAKVSAGVLLYRRSPNGLEILVAHPGGPYFARRSEGVWTIPKGAVEPGESYEDAARREFLEETGFSCPARLMVLTPVRMRSGKRIHAFAGEGDADPSALISNTFEMEVPKGSGRIRAFPEIDRVRFVLPAEARRLLHSAQVPLIGELEQRLGDD